MYGYPLKYIFAISVVVIFVVNSTLYAKEPAGREIAVQSQSAQHEAELRSRTLVKQTPPSDACQNTSIHRSTISLADVVTAALCNAPETRQAYAQLMEKARSYPLPDERTTPSITAHPAAPYNSIVIEADITKQTSQSTSVTAGLTLADFGKREASLAASEQWLVVAAREYDALAQRITQEASTHYYDALHAQSNYRAIELLEQEMADIQRYAPGKKHHKPSIHPSKTDVLHSLQAQHATIRNIMALPADYPIILVDVTNAALVDAPVADSTEAMLTEALKNRSDIEAAREKIRASEASLKAFEYAALPDISASVGQSLTDYNIADNKDRNQSIGISIRIPLFDSGERDIRRQNTQKQLDAQKAALARLKNTVIDDVINSWNRYVDARTQWNKSLEALSRANDQYQQQLALLKKSPANKQNTLNALTTRHNLLVNHLKNRHLLLQARAALIHAVGIISRPDLQP